MAERLSALFRSRKQINVSAESIRIKPLTERQRAVLADVARRQKRGDATQIDYSDIPALTDKHLAQFRRPPKKLAAVGPDADVFA